MKKLVMIALLLNFTQLMAKEYHCTVKNSLDKIIVDRDVNLDDDGVLYTITENGVSRGYYWLAISPSNSRAVLIRNVYDQESFQASTTGDNVSLKDYRVDIECFLKNK